MDAFSIFYFYVKYRKSISINILSKIEIEFILIIDRSFLNLIGAI